MPSRYLLQDFQDLPDFIESHYKEVTKEIIGLKNKLKEIEANEKYHERNVLVETQQKKKEIQQKLDDFHHEILEGELKRALHLECALKFLPLHTLTCIKEELNYKFEKEEKV
jgi:hypothetical protein